MNVPTLGNANFGDEIIVSGTIDRDIVLTVKAHSKFVNDVDDPDEKTIEKVLEIYKLCFGLEIDKREEIKRSFWEIFNQVFKI